MKNTLINSSKLTIVNTHSIGKFSTSTPIKDIGIANSHIVDNSNIKGFLVNPPDLKNPTISIPFKNLNGINIPLIINNFIEMSYTFFSIPEYIFINRCGNPDNVTKDKSPIIIVNCIKYLAYLSTLSCLDLPKFCPIMTAAEELSELTIIKKTF